MAIPDFLEIQRKSFFDLLEKGIIKELARRNPIKNTTGELELRFFPEYYRLNPPEWTPQQAILQSKTYGCRLYVPTQLTNSVTKEVQLQWVLLGNLPLMTKRGHFIINGSPRVIINQMVRSPGIYYHEVVDKNKKRSYYADLISYRGAWLRLELDKKKRVWARMKKTPKMSLVVFLQAIGFSQRDLFDSIQYPQILKNSFLKANHPRSTHQALLTLYSETHPKKEKTELTAALGQRFISRKFMNPRTYDLGELGRIRLNKKLGLSIPIDHHVLTPHDILHATDYLIKLEYGFGRLDDIDNLKNRRVRASGEIIQNQLGTGFIRLEKLIREKLKKPKNRLTISNLLTTKAVNGALREFFGSSPLSQLLDQTNPLSEITHKRRLTSLGPGGVNRETAGMAVRGIHPTHYGRICPIETPEGQNAGLVNSLTTYAHINSYGFIETPFFKVYQGQVQKSNTPLFFSAEQEEEVLIAPGDLKQSGLQFLPKNFLPVRLTSEFKKVFRDQVEFISVSPIQMISIATSLIPFLEHDDANRALMGSNMQRQAVPLIQPEYPIVGTGFESRVIADSGHCVQSKTTGFVSYVSGDKVIIQSCFPTPKKFGKRNHHRNRFQTPVLEKKNTKRRFYQYHSNRYFACCSVFENSSLFNSYLKSGSRGSYFSCFPGRLKGVSVASGEIQKRAAINPPSLATESSQFKQLNYPLQSYQRSNQDTCLTYRPAVEEGEWVQKGDLLADGSASCGGDLALGKNILIAYMPWEGYNFEDAILISERLVYDDVYTSIHIERYEVEIRDTKFGVEQITSQIPEIDPGELLHLDQVGIAKAGSWVKEGDILVGKVTPINKKPLSPHEKLLYDIVGKEIPTTRDSSLRVPKGVKGRVIDVQILPTETIPPETAFDGPGRVHIYLAEKRKIQVGDKVAGRHGNKGIVSKILSRHDMPYLPDGTPIDMVLNPLGVPSRMNVGQVFECLFGLAGFYLKEQYKLPPFDEIFGSEASRSLVYSKLYSARLKTGQKWLFNPDFPGKVPVFDGRTGECFDQSITVGKAYVLKLVHLVDEKIHARSTGPYSLVTQQPLRGRSKHGGQRLGEMEVWALEGFGAAYTLQELLTVKSDDLKGRHQVMDAILNNEPITLGTPESFKVLIRELQSLCLDVAVFGVDRSGTRKQIDFLKLA